MTEKVGSIDQEMTGLAIFLLIVELIVLICCIICCCSVEICRIFPFLIDFFVKRRRKRKSEETTTHERLTDENDEEGISDTELDSTNIEEEEEEQQTNQKQSSTDDKYNNNIRFGMMNIIFFDTCSTVLSSTILLFFRLFAFLFIFGFTIADYFNKHDYFFLLTYQHLTMVSFTYLGFYYFISSIYSAVFIFCSIQRKCLCKNNNNKCKICCCLYYIEYVVFILFEIAVLSSVIVTLAFWCLDVPNTIRKTNEFHIGVFTIPLHGLNSAFTIFELFILFKISFHFRHLFLISCYPWIYSLFVTLLVKSKLLEEYPYHGLMSYDQNNFAVFARFGVGLSFSGLHLFICILCLIRKFFVKICYDKAVSTTKKQIQKKKKKSSSNNNNNNDNNNNNEVEMDDFEALAVGMDVEFSSSTTEKKTNNKKKDDDDSFGEEDDDEDKKKDDLKQDESLLSYSSETTSSDGEVE